jgi:NodT family efflux transporter outer membrane factor (OMF) lipoprotein
VKDSAASPWWNSFDDPQLSAVIDRATTGSLELAQATERLTRARALVRVEKSGRLPSLDGRAGYSRTQTSEDAAIGGFPATAETYNLWEAGLDATWELDLFGRVAAGIDAAREDLAAEEEDRRDLLIVIQAEVARAYIDWRGAQRRLAVTEQNLALQEETTRLIEQRAAAGLASELDVVRARAQAQSTAARTPPLRAQADVALNRVAVLCGVTPSQIRREFAADGGTIPIPTGVTTVAPAELVRQRPDIRRAEREVAAALARVGVAEADRYPRFVLSGNLGLSTINLSDLSTGTSDTWSFGPNVSIPLFDGRARRSRVEAQEAAYNVATLAYRQAVLLAFEESENALAEYAREKERGVALSAAAESSRDAVRLASELYRSGMVDFLDVLEAERTLSDAEELLAESTTQQSRRAVAVFKSLGGGW